MAQPTTGTPTTRGVASNDFIGGSIREDLADFITQLSPETTPYLSTLGIGTNKAEQPRHDWQTDELANASIGNAQKEDFEFSSANSEVDVPTRIFNYTQVYGKTIHVPGSLIKSNFAGAQDYYSYQRMKRGKELNRDVELNHLYWKDLTGTSGANTANIVYNGGSETRRAAGLAGYARNFVNASTVGMSIYNGSGVQHGSAAIGSSTGTLGSTPAAATFHVGDLLDGSQAVHHTGATALTAAQKGVVSSDMITQMAKQFTDNNGIMSHIICPTGLKAGFSNALIAGNGGAAQRRASEMTTKVNLTVDMVVTEFGFDVAIVPNYLMNSATTGTSDGYAFAVDSGTIKRSVLTPMTTEEDGTARYGKGFIMFCDETTEVKNPNSVGMFTGLKA